MTIHVTKMLAEYCIRDNTGKNLTLELDTHRESVKWMAPGKA